jgi:hypothetical protein
MSDIVQAPDLSALQEQLAALQAESDTNTQGKIKGFLQSSLEDPTAKYNYTEQLGSDVIDYMLESGLDLKKVSMEVAMAKLDEMMGAQEQIVQQLNEYARQHRRELNDAIRQAENAQDELSAMRQVIQKVENKDQSTETAAVDSVPDLGAPLPEEALAPVETGMPPAPDMGLEAGIPAPVETSMPPPVEPGMPPAPDMGLEAGMPMPLPPQQQQPPQFAQGGYVGSARYNKIKGILGKRRGDTQVLSDASMKKLVRPSRAILQGVLGGV